MTDLVPGQSGGGKVRALAGTGRARHPRATAKRFLTKQKRSLAAFHREVTQVQGSKLRVPARNTVALRIASLDPRKVIRRREGRCRS
ncbi:hypothetical protein ECZU34_58690 [Escherichia coli]|nr:hypothetical protein ECZU34_58690 [Escherichia coli]